MPALTAMIRTLAALLLLTALLELLIPEGTLSRFVRLVMGLALLALLLTPLLNWLEPEQELAGLTQAEDYAAQGEELGRLLEQLAEEEWQAEQQAAGSQGKEVTP